MKTTLILFKDRFEQAEERINELEYRAIEIIILEEQEKEKNKLK